MCPAVDRQPRNLHTLTLSNHLPRSWTSIVSVMQVMYCSICPTLIFSLINPFTAVLPTSALPFTFELRQNSSLPSLVQSISSVGFNPTNQSLDRWPVHLPIRFPIPNNPSAYLIIPSYTRPEPLRSIDDVLNALSSMAHHLSTGRPDEVMNSIKLRVGGIEWSLTNERTFDITREAAFVILGAVADVQTDYGVASLTNVLFQRNGFLPGSFNFTIETDQAPVIPSQEAESLSSEMF